MVAKAPSFPMYPDDLIRDCSMLTAEERGCWAWFLLTAHSSNERGQMEMELWRWAGFWNIKPERVRGVLCSIVMNEIGDVAVNGDDVTDSHKINMINNAEDNAMITLKNRRMRREANVKEGNRLRQEKLRAKRTSNANVTDESNDEITEEKDLPSSSSSFSSSKPSSPTPPLKEEEGSSSPFKIMNSFDLLDKAFPDEFDASGISCASELGDFVFKAGGNLIMSVSKLIWACEQEDTKDPQSRAAAINRIPPKYINMVTNVVNGRAAIEPKEVIIDSIKRSAKCEKCDFEGEVSVPKNLAKFARHVTACPKCGYELVAQIDLATDEEIDKAVNHVKKKLMSKKDKDENSST